MNFFLFFLILTSLTQTAYLQSSAEIKPVAKASVQQETHISEPLLHQLPEPIRKIIALYAAEWVHYRTIDRWCYPFALGMSHVAFSEDNKHMTLVRNRARLDIYDIEQNKITKQLTMPKHPDNASFVLSQNGHYYLVPPQHKQKKYHLLSPYDSKITVAEAHIEPFASAITNDGKKFAFAFQIIWMCDIKSGWKSVGADGIVTGLLFSPDGNCLVAKVSHGINNTKILFIDCKKLIEGTEKIFSEHDLGTFCEHELNNCSLFFTKDHKYLALIGAFSNSSKIYFISLAEKKLAYTFDTGYQQLKCIDFSDKNEFMITSNHESADLWIQESEQSWRKIQNMFNATGVGPWQVALSPDGSYCTIGTCYERLYIFKIFHGLNQLWLEDPKKETKEDLLKSIATTYRMLKQK